MQGGAAGGAAGGAIIEETVDMEVEANEETGGRTETVRKEQMIVSADGIETR